MRDTQAFTQDVYVVTLVNASQSVLREGPAVIMAANGTIIQGGDTSVAAEPDAWHPGIVSMSYSPTQTPIEASATPLFSMPNHPNLRLLSCRFVSEDLGLAANPAAILSLSDVNRSIGRAMAAMYWYGKLLSTSM